MIIGTRHICDRCGASIGNDRVRLGAVQDVVQDSDRSPLCNGWIAHYHPDCFEEIACRIDDAAGRLPMPVLDSVAVLNSIPVIHENVLRGLRSHHRMPDGKTPAEAEHERYREGKVRWRRMTSDERDSVILDALGDQTLALWPLSTALDTRCNVIVMSETLRSHLKSMASRRLLVQDTEKPARGRARMCWRTCAHDGRGALKEREG